MGDPELREGLRAQSRMTDDRLPLDYNA